MKGLIRFQRGIYLSDITLEDIRGMIKGNHENFHMLHIRSATHPTYKAVRRLVNRVHPETDDNIYAVSKGFESLIDTLPYMEDKDFSVIVEMLRRYDIRGEARPISGTKTYAFDKSRVDGKLIRRKRSN